MKHEYEIPRVRVGTPPLFIWLSGVGLLLTFLLIRHTWFVLTWDQYRFVAVLWMMYFAITAFQWGIAWLERPYTVNAAERAALNRLSVTVSLPVYNEDPQTLDRVLYALFHQSRLPDRVELVDDGSTVDYDDVRAWWTQHCPRSVRFTWIRQQNTGKKRAQFRTFDGDQADVFITLDSDTVLEPHAVEEGLKPFNDPRVQSVAGLELAWNHDRNLLTRLNSTRQLVWQLVTCSSQNVLRGNVLINRGTFALYRGSLIREVLQAYVGETFRGRPMKLGDDTFLTTMALCRGRAVQQPSAVCLAMYPERVSHQIRQWTRWMRGTALRTFWRLRYLRITSWAWIYSVVSLWWYVASIATAILLAVRWPATAAYTNTMIAVGTLWAWVMATRLTTIQRSDQGRLGRLGAAAINPIAVLWVLTVLRFLRIYGNVTFLRQGWSTRSRIEISTGSEPDATPANEPEREAA